MPRRRYHDPSDPALFPDLITDAQPESRPAAPPRWFSAQRSGSAVKTKIIVDYFRPWANVMKARTRSGKIGYFDFFAGPGIYDDGTESTPVQIMRIVLADERLRSVAMTLFEDKDPAATDSLTAALVRLPDYAGLKHAPMISNGESARTQIQDAFSTQAVIPTFMFLDPFGYAGLTRDLMRAILKDWGCDIAFYFNFNRINAALRNSKVRGHMNALFGSDRVETARAALAGSKDEELRESILIGSMREALYEIGAHHVLVFRFRKQSGPIDHHLIFATKNLDPAQKIMKSIMSGASSSIDPDGVGSFEFSPSVEGSALPLSASTPMQTLRSSLLEAFKGRSLSVAAIYAEHNEGTPFTIKNYQDALRSLAYDDRAVHVARGQFMPTTNVSVQKRHMSEQYIITFPP